jgi:proteasome lid subunit RPN8/RPN11
LCVSRGVLPVAAEVSMTLLLSEDLLQQIRVHGESRYPYEGAGLILGHMCNGTREAIAIMPLANRSAVHSHRYLLDPHDMLVSEIHAERLGLDILGIFHSHPDSPAIPSQQDLDTAFPWFSYLITSIQAGVARLSRSWRLEEERGIWTEEGITIQACSCNREHSQEVDR